jgi:hypothetical protein
MACSITSLRLVLLRTHILFHRLLLQGLQQVVERSVFEHDTTTWSRAFRLSGLNFAEFASF